MTDNLTRNVEGGKLPTVAAFALRIVFYRKIEWRRVELSLCGLSFFIDNENVKVKLLI